MCALGVVNANKSQVNQAQSKTLSAQSLLPSCNLEPGETLPVPNPFSPTCSALARCVRDRLRDPWSRGTYLKSSFIGAL
jgi:hypothetical protein